MALNRRTLRQHEDKILRGLASFYYENGYTSEAYRDDETGGIYEHKLASRLKYAGDRSPPEFLEACRMLAAQGLVVRRKRQQDFPEMGIWPTLAGLDRAEYLESRWWKKAWMQVEERWPEILVAVVVTVMTLTIGWFFGLFGLRP